MAAAVAAAAFASVGSPVGSCVVVPFGDDPFVPVPYGLLGR